MDEQSLMVQEYCKHPVRNRALVDCTIERYEGNVMCGDDITIYLYIKDDHILDYGYNGNCSMITSAAASVWGELLIGESLDVVLGRSYDVLREHGFEVSHRRRRSAIIALIAVKNAIVLYRGLESLFSFDNY